MWKMFSFNEVIIDDSAGNPKIAKQDYLEQGTLPVVDQSQREIGGFTNQLDLKNQTKLPCILFGDHTKIFKYIDYPFVRGADGTKILSTSEQLDTRFAFHYLRNVRLPETGYDRNFKYLQRIKVPLPPLPEQCRIAAILDEADAIRKKRKQSIQLADQFLRSVFLEMFGDPVRNEKGWQNVVFENACPTRLGKMLDSKQQTGKYKRPYLRNENLQWHRVQVDDLLTMDFDEDDRIEFELKYGDLLICEGGEPGRAAVWRSEITDCYFQKAIHRGRPNPQLATPEYLEYLLWFFAKRGGFNGIVSTATIAHLTGIKLKQLRVPLPPVELQKKFANIVFAHSKTRTKLQKEESRAELLFNSLAQRAFRGEL